MSDLSSVVQVLFPAAGSPSPENPGWRLLLCALPRHEAAELAIAEGASVLALVDVERERIALFDDGGNETILYVGLQTEAAPLEAFLLGDEGPWTWGLSTGQDLLFPEHARTLAAAGMDVLCILPARDEERLPLPLEVLARARALENQVYVVLLAPKGEESLFVDPSGFSIPLAEEHGFPTATVRRGVLAAARKARPLLDVARKSPFAGLAKR